MNFSLFLSAFALVVGSFQAQSETIRSEDHFMEDIFAVQTLANLSIDGQQIRRYAVRVRNCAANLAQIMLTVENSGVKVSGGGIQYTDGSNESYSITYTFPAGYQSSWIDVDSFRREGKCVASVFVNAQSTDTNVRARVKVYGSTL